MFSKTTKLDNPNHSVQSEEEEPEQCKKIKFIYKETVEKLDLKILAPYLDNAYEETVFESSQIKAQQETVKLLNWELCLETLKILRMNCTDQCMSYKLFISEKRCLFYSILTIVKLKNF